MITRIRGKLAEIESNFAIIDVNGIFYQIFCPRKTLDQLINIDEIYTLYTEFVVREDSMSLYGFFSKKELEAFKFITNVQGVGMKVGIAILSIATSNEIYEAINIKNKDLFTKADGVGPKLANRIVNELKDKIGNININQTNPDTSSNLNNSLEKKYKDAISALMNLGYKTFDANQAVEQTQKHNPETVEQIIKLALAQVINNTNHRK